MEEADLEDLQRRARAPITGENIKVPASMDYEAWGKARTFSSEAEYVNYMGETKVFDNGVLKVKGYTVNGTENVYAQTYSENAKRLVSFIQKLKTNVPELNELEEIVVIKILRGWQRTIM